MHLEDKENLPTGTLEVAVFKKGLLYDFWRDENLVVNAARAMLAQLVAGDSAGSAITKIGFGVGSTPADPDETSLSSAYVRNLTGHSYPEAGKVRFEFALNISEANGSNQFEPTNVMRNPRNRFEPKNAARSGIPNARA